MFTCKFFVLNDRYSPSNCPSISKILIKTGEDGNLSRLKLMKDVAGLGYTVTLLSTLVEDEIVAERAAIAVLFQQFVMGEDALPACGKPYISSMVRKILKWSI